MNALLDKYNQSESKSCEAKKAVQKQLSTLMEEEKL
jgi:hypothetical protein